MMSHLTQFTSVYSATNTNKVSEEVILKYQNKLPDALLNLWKSHGFGKYNNGLIEIINPDEYQITLEHWLGKKVDNYVPIALSAFGRLFYYRKLTETDEDVSVINPHYKEIDVCVWSLQSFFDDYVCQEDVMQFELQKELFTQALDVHGGLKSGEMYYFVPALPLGGAESIDYIQKGNASVHLDFLLQL